MELGASLELWRALEEVSSKLTELVGRTCQELGLDPDVSVLVSLERFCEDRECGRGICGYYDPSRRLVVVSLPCLAEEGDLAGRLAETLAHELVHHCQFTRGRLCEVHLDPELAARMCAALPYRLRPHELEAYKKQCELAEKLRKGEGFAEAANLLERLYPPVPELLLRNANAILQASKQRIIHPIHETEDKDKVLLNQRLIKACKMGKKAKDLVRKLLKEGADVNVRDEQGWTPLHHAAMRGAASVVLLLLEKGADVNARASDGATPLHMAAAYSNPNVVDLLISKGADVNAKDNSGRTPLHYAVMNSSLSTVELLLSRKANPNAADNEGRTPLHYAVEREAISIVKYLIKKHVNINIHDKYGKTPLDIAHEKSNLRITTMLARSTSKAEARGKTGAGLRHQRVACSPLLLEVSTWGGESGLPLVRIMFDAGECARDEICVLYFYPGKRVYVSWMDGRRGERAVGEELERELAAHLGAYIKGTNPSELAKQVTEVLNKLL